MTILRREAIEDLVLTLDSTFSDYETAKRKGYITRDMPTLHRIADIIRGYRNGSPVIPESTATFDPSTLSDDDLSNCLHEMRRRTWIVAAYDTDAIVEILPDGADADEDDIKAWLHEHHTELEQAMCEPVYRWVEEEWPAQDEDTEGTEQ